ncbi:Heavy-metal-associated domain, partial [Rhizoctonia solani]
MSEQTYKFNVVMTCGGCSGAIERVLKKAKESNEGVSSYEVSLDKQEVLVTGTLSYDGVLSKIKKTGKEVKSGETVTPVN